MSVNRTILCLGADAALRQALAEAVRRGFAVRDVGADELPALRRAEAAPGEGDFVVVGAFDEPTLRTAIESGWPVVCIAEGDEGLTEPLRLGAEEVLTAAEVRADLGPFRLARAVETALLRGRRHASLRTEVTRLQTLCDTAQQFVDNVSHEFRTPLTVIKDSVGLIHDGFAGPVAPEQRAYLQSALARVDDLALLVDEMLDVSRLEAGRLGVWRQRCRLGDVLERVAKFVQRRGTQRGLTVATDVSPELPLAYADPDHVQRVLINLAVNAIKFTPDGGRVTLWARPDEQGLIRAGVTDNGPGIPRDKLALIFDRFQQAGRSVRSAPKGFGLGLSIARELVHLGYGTLDVASTPGQGSIFSFTVPIDDPPRLFARVLERHSGHVTLLRVVCKVGSHVLAGESVDEFLQLSGHARDFTYRTSPESWVVLTAGGPDETAERIDKLRREWDEQNRNRPQGRLPDLRLRAAGTWHLEPATGHETLLAELGRIREEDARPTPPQVLLVDDDEDVLRALTVRLRAAGYDVLTAADGRAGLSAARTHQPDAIVLDVSMPQMDGLTMLHELRQHETTVGIPVVMLSASLRDRQRALEHGARFFLAKPYDSKHLLTALETFSGASR